MSDPKGAERPTPQHWKSARMAACRARRQGERNDFVNLLEYFEDTERQRDALAERLKEAERERCHHGWRGSVPKDGQRIVTPCPECGHQSLFIGSGGHLTCAWVPSDHNEGCPNPSVEGVVTKLRQRAYTAESRLATLIDAAGRLAVAWEKLPRFDYSLLLPSDRKLAEQGDAAAAEILK